MMRIWVLILLVTASSTAAAEPKELATGPDAVLCLSADSLGAEGEGLWSVRYRPQGMSGGITLWGRPSAFTLPDGTPLQRLRAEY
jgi:hypothetical protein